MAASRPVTVPPATATSPRHRGLRTALLVVAGFNLLSCLFGAWGVGAAGPLLFGTDLLAGTAFDGLYWVGALLLGGVVGGTQALAIVLHLRRSGWTPFGHLLAGVTMLCWIYGEITVIGGGSWLQHLYFATGLAQAGLATMLLGAIPVPHRTTD